MNFANGKENCLMHAPQNEVANKNWSELQVEFKYVIERVTIYWITLELGQTIHEWHYIVHLHCIVDTQYKQGDYKKARHAILNNAY